ncbi:DUF3786 domain-containing protein [Clostridioides difficile]|uniref:DUF3786 domain-containing protein n=1 Tax=Clostridioides difficile TaxID=1496 RepID=UPI00038D2BFC|nr:DUF3786 domain-containing protein [Clostridioides difficile]EGT4637390.1 DUF3786 domain-containing protein [Clostridioides difficile]EQJ78730.1 hypothetical protein QU9_3500 [Clostridioides difficile P48]MBH8103197.1 DUF3786 domain-containing protein [Clostridioides difficile]MCA0606950.1 DUF3786 domain-containing protein [Clostridioides difficile]MCO5924832.1 DUF3786 domain-containing protein [Clostridioides difficile]
MDEKITKNNYNVPFDYVRKKLKELDPHTISNLSNIPFNNDLNRFTLNFFDRQYIIDYPSGEVWNSNGSLCNNFELKILIVRYLINAKGIPRTNKYVTFKEIPGGNVYYPNFLNRTLYRLSEVFTSQIDKYKLVMEKIGAEKVNMGDLAYRFTYMGNTSMVFILWFGDDEFPPNSNILFDSNIVYYFNAEDLAVVPDIAINAILNKINQL